MAQARPSDYPNIFVGFEIYDSSSTFFCGGGTFVNLFYFHFLAEDDHAMPAYLDRVPFVLYQLILSGSEIQHYIYGFHFAFNRSSPSTEIWNGICSRQSCKEIPRNRYSRPKDLEDENRSINGMCAKPH